MTGDTARAINATVAADEAGLRLDRFLASRLSDISRSRLQALIRAGAVTLNGATIGDAGLRVKPGDTVRVAVPEPEPAGPAPEAIPLDIVYEDEALIVIDKPPGLVVHPGAGHAAGTLVNALLAHCGAGLSGIGGVRRPGIVHRLDKDTSGLLVVAKTDVAHKGLADQFAAHGRDGRLERRYVALVWGAMPRPSGAIDLPLARSSQNRTKIAVSGREDARHAITHWRRLEVFEDREGTPIASLVELALETGRTHQIRVHMAHIGHPVMGDAIYGAGFKASISRLTDPAAAALRALARQALHAAMLGFVHPVTGKRLSFSRPPPADMQRLIEALRAPSDAQSPGRPERRRQSQPLRRK